MKIQGVELDGSANAANSAGSGRMVSPRIRHSWTRRRSILSVGVCISGIWLFMSSIAGPAPAAAEEILEQALGVGEPISPIPEKVDLDAGKVALGRRLFNDSRLSGGNGVSCASCHHADRALTDGAEIARGLPGHPHVLNTPTLFNVSLNPKIGWSGAVLTLEKQVEAVLENKRAMGANWSEVIATLRNDSELEGVFNSLYEDGIQKENVIDAIVQFERSLVTPNAPFDRYLRGDENAISDEAKVGYQLFKDYGCSSCHQGVNVGGNMLQIFGIFGEPASASLGAKTPGAAQNSGIADDRPVFRVPPLRNVEHTAPYFHDGSAKTLPDAISVMARYQLGRDIPDAEIRNLETFLKSLTGEYQGNPVGGLR